MKPIDAWWLNEDKPKSGGKPTFLTQKVLGGLLHQVENLSIWN